MASSTPLPTSSLSHRVAIVTGSSRGIGRGIALELARQGASVVLTGRDEAALQNVSEEIRVLGGQSLYSVLDLREATAAGELVKAALGKFGRLDILVNNAGATKRGAFTALSEEDWQDGFALKFFGAVRLTREAWPHLKAQGGSVIQIAGVGGRTPGAEFSIGGSVNAALLSFTKALADTGIADGIQVNAINPGFIRTDRLQKRLQALADQRGVSVEDAAAVMVKNAQVSRLGEVEDIAHLAAFMVSPQGRFLHGAIVDMDGGQTKTL